MIVSFDVNFKVGDEVWDKLTLKKTTITGMEIKTGRRCCSDNDEYQIRYYVDDHTCMTYRNEEDLELVSKF